MSEYIDREKLIADIKNRYCRLCEKLCRACWVDDMIDEIEGAPTAEVVKVRHGKWLRNVLFNGTHTCSLCNSDPIHYDGATGYVEILSEYCPHCGAKMDLEEEKNDL